MDAKQLLVLSRDRRVAEDVLGVVQLCAREPLRPGHFGVFEDVRWRPCQDDIEKVDDAALLALAVQFSKARLIDNRVLRR